MAMAIVLATVSATSNEACSDVLATSCPSLMGDLNCSLLFSGMADKFQ